jgi:hypothetical protein
LGTILIESSPIRLRKTLNRNPLVEMTEKILDLSVVTDKKLIAAEGAAHFWWDKDFYYIDKSLLTRMKLCCAFLISTNLSLCF